MLLHTLLTQLPESDWTPFWQAEIDKPYFTALDAFVTEEVNTQTIYPAAQNIFAAFRTCPADRVKVVILGQDPYHEPGQAMGLSFSVPDDCKTPPSLRNIFKELAAEYGPVPCPHNDLTPWARQGVLLLNTVLTVREGAAFSHAGKGWETFTRAALQYLTARGTTPLVAILWGKPAQRYASLFRTVADRRPVLVLESAHPSPLSAYRGFFGSAPFGKANDFLRAHGQKEILWQTSTR